MPKSCYSRLLCKRKLKPPFLKTFGILTTSNLTNRWDFILKQWNEAWQGSKIVLFKCAKKIFVSQFCPLGSLTFEVPFFSLFKHFLAPKELRGESQKSTFMLAWKVDFCVSSWNLLEALFSTFLALLASIGIPKVLGGKKGSKNMEG